jgi:RimJ/RimL family protein N-acetyltransferase
MLKSERTYLRPTKADDIPHRYEWFNDAEFSRLYIGKSVYTSYEQVENEVRVAMQPTPYSGLMELAIQTVEDNRHIGNTFFRKINWQDRHAEFGIFIGTKDRWGSRLGSEVTKIMIDYGFRELGFHRLWLTVFAYNHRAIRCFEKCGFKKESVFREVIFSGGVFHDVVGMSILEGETEIPYAKSL